MQFALYSGVQFLSYRIPSDAVILLWRKQKMQNTVFWCDAK